jgi:hypothetical protein
MGRRSLLAATLGVSLLAATPGRSEDRVSVHGAYFREASTRVVQPMIQISKDLPGGVDVGAHFLVDAITSASVAAGGGADALFTELRKEAGVVVGKTWNRTRLSLSYRQSREPDYISHTAGVQWTQGVWDNSGTFNLRLAGGHDTVGPMLDQNLSVYFGGASYTQALSPTLLAQLGYEAAVLHGYQGNPYVSVPNVGHEKPPDERLRHTVAARVAKYLPSSRTGLQLYYRFYIDQKSLAADENPWDLTAHTVEGRVFQELPGNLEVRFSYRYHHQGKAAFWCLTDPSRGGSTECYGVFPRYASVDDKLGPLTTHTPQVKLVWEARGLGGVPVLDWLAQGAFDVSYGYYVQSSKFGNAHLLETGYSLPF